MKKKEAVTEQLSAQRRGKAPTARLEQVLTKGASATVELGGVAGASDAADVVSVQNPDDN